MGEVGCEDERPPGQLLQVVILQVEFHCYLGVIKQNGGHIRVRGDAQLKDGTEIRKRV